VFLIPESIQSIEIRKLEQEKTKRKKEKRYMMKNFTKMTLLGAGLAAFLLPAMAQTSSAPANATAAPSAATAPATASTPADANTPATSRPETIQQRKVSQQDRIANGIANGSLTAKESSGLEKQESQLNQEERDMKAEDNGHLTQADRAALHQQQNQLSNEIYQDKHNAAAQHYGSGEVDQRAERQQDRIAQGVNNGTLSAGQASHLEGQEAAINKEANADRAANGGKLTPQERAKINRQQNHLSKQIHNAKHK